MKKTLYIQPNVKVEKIDVEEPIAYSGTATQNGISNQITVNDVPFYGTAISPKGTDNGQNLQSKGTSFDFADE